MKKANYVEPKMDIITLQITDILTTSTDAFDGEWVPIGRSIPDVNDPPTL